MRDRFLALHWWNFLLRGTALVLLLLIPLGVFDWGWPFWVAVILITVESILDLVVIRPAPAADEAEAQSAQRLGQRSE